MNNIAVILTCHNRKEVTKKCLDQLCKLHNNLDVYCVDDNSTDGTSQMIRDNFPNIHLIEGTGNLFWSRGMRLAWSHALESEITYDYYIWLNDDLILYPYAFDELLEISSIYNDYVVISGLVQESSTKEAIYGGHSKGKIIVANGKCNDIDNMNGNFVLVTSKVVDKIGILDPIYHHDLGDVDYGLTAKENGIPVVTSRKYIGMTDGKLKSPHKRNRRWGTTIVDRFKKLYSPLGSNPNITFHFMKKHKGVLPAITYYCYVHAINLMPDCIFNKITK